MIPNVLKETLLDVALAKSKVPSKATYLAWGLAFALLYLGLCESIYARDVYPEEPIQWQWQNIDRVVVFPDVHGAYPELVRLLQVSRVIDENLKWSGNNTHLISLGDLLDRGPQSRQTMDLLMRLQHEAAVAGGKVHVLAGNHELMNLVGDLRYVSKAEYREFASDESAADRENGYRDFISGTDLTFENQSQSRMAFEKMYPPGYFAHRDAFSVDGKYGSWLLSLPAIITVNDMAFVHASLPEMVSQHGLEKINQDYQTITRRYIELWHALIELNVLTDNPKENPELQAASRIQNSSPSDCLQSRQKDCLEQVQRNQLPTPVINTLKEFLALSEHPILSSDSPLWSRGAVYCRALHERPILDTALQKLGVQQVIVGHTVTADARAHSLHADKLIMLDTGMLIDYYQGRPAALIVENGKKLVQYLNPEEKLAPLHDQLPGSYGLSKKELELALTTAQITAIDKPTGAQLGVGGQWKVQLSHNNKNIMALFYPDDRLNTHKKELAAHKLDEVLGFELVPLTVSRTIDNNTGALQLEHPDSITEDSRIKNNTGIGGWCSLPRQYQLMYAWDLLTANSNRSASNIHYRQDLGLVYLTDHSKAFGQRKTLPKTLRKDLVILSPEVRAQLAILDEQKLQQAMGDTINKSAIRSLLKRRNAMLKKLD